MNCTGGEAVRFVIDGIMSSKCSTLISFHFTTRLSLFWLYKLLLAEAKLKLFPLICLLNLAY
jgi:hypothetical protein